MNLLILCQYRTPCAALALCLATFLGGLPLGLAAESAPPPEDPSAVQERAVRRGEVSEMPGTVRCRLSSGNCCRN